MKIPRWTEALRRWQVWFVATGGLLAAACPRPHDKPVQQDLAVTVVTEGSCPMGELSIDKKRAIGRRPVPMMAWACPFPNAPETVRALRVSLAVCVEPNGVPSQVYVKNDPGYGAGAAASECVMRKRYEPGIDESGVTASWLWVNINYVR